MNFDILNVIVEKFISVVQKIQMRLMVIMEFYNDNFVIENG